jgi:peptide deformylase
MILPIVQYGAPILRKKCRPVEEVDANLENLVEDMIETMHDASGVGLAAPQVAVDLRLAIVDVSHDPDSVGYLRINGRDTPLEDLMPLVFMNPDLEGEGDREAVEEGCLSIHDIRAKVIRPSAIRGDLTLLDGSRIRIETDGLLARAIQHETDHLNGILFVDRLSAAAKLSIRGKLKRLRAG